MKILVTGGAGFIGSHLVDIYINAGHDVVVVDNLSSGKKESLNPRARFYQLDILSPEIADVFRQERPEVLNHHAAQINVRKSVLDPGLDGQINILGLLNLMESARKSGVRKVVFASSGGTIYGEQKEFPATEEHSTNPVSPYGIAKLASEKYLAYYEIQYGIPFVALRYANVYGPRQCPHGEAGVVAIFISKMLNGEQPVINGDGAQTRDYVHVDDVAKVNLLALGPDVRGIYNVGTGIETNVNTVFEIVNKHLNAGFSAKHGPEMPGEQRRSLLSFKRMETELEFKPSIDFNEGIVGTIRHFRASR